MSDSTAESAAEAESGKPRDGAATGFKHSRRRPRETGDDWQGGNGAVLEEHATERQLAQVLTYSLPPLKCVDEVWYVYQNGYWKKTDKSLYKPRALSIQHQRSRKSRMASAVLTHVEYEHQIDQALLRSFHYMTEAGEILLNCQNGILSVTEKEVKLLPHVQDCNFTGQIAAAYEPAAEAPIFSRVLNDALPEQDDVLLFGPSLFGVGNCEVNSCLGDLD